MDRYLAFAARGKNAWWRYVLTFVVAMAIFALSMAIMGVLVAIRVLRPEQITQMMTPEKPGPFFIGNGVVFGIILVGFIAGAAMLQAKRFGDVIGAWSWRLVGAGAAIWTLGLVLATLADLAVQPSGFRITASASTATLALAATLGLGAQTFAEEWVFRGWLTQGLLLATKRPLVAAVLAGLIFGSVHIPNGLPQAVGATAFGIATSLIAIRLGGIAFTWGLHVVNNVFGAVVVVSGGDVFRGSPGVFTQSTPGLMWWDVTAEVAVLAALLWLVFRRRQAPAPA